MGEREMKHKKADADDNNQNHFRAEFGKWTQDRRKKEEE